MEKNEFEHKFIITPILERRNGQDHDIESIYEPNIKSARYGEQEERVLARIIPKIKEFILYYGFTKAILQRRENQEIGGVLSRECGRHWTL